VAKESRQEPSAATGAAALRAGWSHRHRDVSGGWLRPTVFGAVDGLVTNASLIAGVGGGGASPHAVVLTGVAALVAGAFSMGTGEYVSVTNQNELVQRVHTREELGVDPDDLPSPVLAGAASLLAFALGALVPLAPYLAGLPVLAVALGITAVALLAGGMMVGRLTGRSMLGSGLRQLALGALAIGVTFGVGSLIGGHVRLEHRPAGRARHLPAGVVAAGGPKARGPVGGRPACQPGGEGLGPWQAGRGIGVRCSGRRLIRPNLAVSGGVQLSVRELGELVGDEVHPAGDQHLPVGEQVRGLVFAGGVQGAARGPGVGGRVVEVGRAERAVAVGHEHRAIGHRRAAFSGPRYQGAAIRRRTFWPAVISKACTLVAWNGADAGYHAACCPAGMVQPQRPPPACAVR